MHLHLLTQKHYHPESTLIANLFYALNIKGLLLSVPMAASAYWMGFSRRPKQSKKCLETTSHPVQIFQSLSVSCLLAPP